MAGRRAPLVVATWNVHACIGSDGVYAPERTLAGLDALGAGIVALQEIHARPWTGGGPDAARELARRLDYEAVLGPTLVREQADYGNALLTRLPVRWVRRLDLSLPGREPRGALAAAIGWHGAWLHVVTAHLGLVRAERRWQVQRLSAWLDAAPRDPAPATTLLLGDWNDWTPGARGLRPLRRHAAPFTRRRTFPARWPVLALDRIAVAAPARLVRVETLADPALRGSSDHLALRATVALPARDGDRGSQECPATFETQDRPRAMGTRSQSYLRW